MVIGYAWVRAFLIFFFFLEGLLKRAFIHFGKIGERSAY